MSRVAIGSEVATWQAAEKPSPFLAYVVSCCERRSDGVLGWNEQRAEAVRPYTPDFGRLAFLASYCHRGSLCS